MILIFATIFIILAVILSRYKNIIIKEHLSSKKKKNILNLQHMIFSRMIPRTKKFILYDFDLFLHGEMFARCVRIIRCILAQFSMPRLADHILSLATWLRESAGLHTHTVELAVASSGLWRCKFISSTSVHRGGSFRARRSYNSLMLSNELCSRKRGSRFLPFWSG